MTDTIESLRAELAAEREAHTAVLSAHLDALAAYDRWNEAADHEAPNASSTLHHVANLLRGVYGPLAVSEAAVRERVARAALAPAEAGAHWKARRSTYDGLLALVRQLARALVDVSSHSRLLSHGPNCDGCVALAEADRVLADEPPAESAPQTGGAPVCATCNDTHRMTLGGREVMCTFCPSPCQRCRSGGTGPYCATTPCACECHVRLPAAPAPLPAPAAAPETGSEASYTDKIAASYAEEIRAEGESALHECEHGEALSGPKCDAPAAAPDEPTIEEVNDAVRCWPDGSLSNRIARALLRRMERDGAGGVVAEIVAWLRAEADAWESGSPSSVRVWREIADEIERREGGSRG